MTDKVKIRRNSGTTHESDGLVSIEELMPAVGTNCVYHPESAVTLSDNHQGRLVILTGECEVTIPADLRPGFSCGWAQASEDAITFVAGDGVTIRSFGGSDTSGGQYALGGIARMPDGEFWLYGQLQ
ncbi:hypothetical protein ACFFP0_25400 [Rhizobium puerariae]|uniref:DUF2190 family protein n=1 Tax=Rhizobium puerariae TaxID=1585791 RepID=A0ABV6AS90_9HYPH